MGTIKGRFYTNRDMREFDARLRQMEETLQQVLDYITEEVEGPVRVEHVVGRMYRVVQGDRILFPSQTGEKTSAYRKDCESYIEEYLAKISEAPVEGADVDLEDVATIAENLQQEPGPVLSPKPESDLIPEKLGSHELESGAVERYVKFTDGTERVLSEAEFEKAREGGLEALMEIVNS